MSEKGGCTSDMLMYSHQTGRQKVRTAGTNDGYSTLNDVQVVLQGRFSRELASVLYLRVDVCGLAAPYGRV